MRLTDYLPHWAPNIHPLVVHFPIALLLTAAGLDVAALALRGSRSLRLAATTAYVVGTVALVGTYFSGRAAAQTIWMPGMAQAMAGDHWTWALRTVWFFCALTTIRLALFVRREPRPMVVLALVLAGLVGVVRVGETADRGGRLVYQFGVGTAPSDPRD